MSRYFYVLCLAIVSTGLYSCQTGSTVPCADGTSALKRDLPNGMVFVPAGTFIMGETDGDKLINPINQSKGVSVSAFYMDETEVTNAQYRQFVYWVRDSLARKLLTANETASTAPRRRTGPASGPARGFGSRTTTSGRVIYFKRTRSGVEIVEQLEPLFKPASESLSGVRELNDTVLKYTYTWFDFPTYYENELNNPGQKIPIADLIKKDEVGVYPDTLVWIRDFKFAMNEPFVWQYFSNPAFNNYPVVGVTWRQARAYAHWREYKSQSASSKRNKDPYRSQLSLPTEAQFEYAMRGGKATGTDFPMGGPYFRNKTGCFTANFKPGDGDYASDGSVFTAPARSYFPNDFGLYNIAGNVAEWTSSTYQQSFTRIVGDVNPEYGFDPADRNNPAKQNKVVKGGSWKDVAYFLQPGTRTYEHLDSSRSFIGFRLVSTYTGATTTNR